MATLNVTNDQLKLIQDALDFYSRVGIGQLNVIKDHPTYRKVLHDSLKEDRPLKVGDQTNRGLVVEIGDGYVVTEGIWDGLADQRKWEDVENVHLHLDYDKYHEIRDAADSLFAEGRNLLLQSQVSKHGSFGIFHEQVDESCRVAYDLVQVIRHEFWKSQDDRSEMSVASSVTHWATDSKDIKCTID